MTRKQQHENMYQQITKHGENLIRLFNLPIDTGPVKLCKSLQRLETKAHHAATCLSNTNTLDRLELNRFTGYDVHQATEDEQTVFFDKILKSVDKLLNFKKQHIPVFVNFDPRGYALKIRPEYVEALRAGSNGIETDWGGFGLIAPEFTGE